MTISVGDRLPSGKFRVMTAEGPAERTTAEVFSGKTVLLFGVPGAFTPTCHRNHMKGYVEHAAAIRAKGVDTIAVTAVNDVFVMAAWADASSAKGIVEFLADGSADYAKALGLTMDSSAFGMGIRSKRYAMLVADGVVKALEVEDVPSKADASGAVNMMKHL